MSVQKDKRSDGKLTLPVLSRQHAKYVIQITKNPKVFDPAYNQEVTADLVRQAKDINRCIWSANQIKVTSTELYQDRRKLQAEAVMLCRSLLADIAIAKGIFHLKGKRVKYWTENLIEIRNRTQAWMEYDADRYRKYR